MSNELTQQIISLSKRFGINLPPDRTVVFDYEVDQTEFEEWSEENFPRDYDKAYSIYDYPHDLHLDLTYTYWRDYPRCNYPSNVHTTSFVTMYVLPTEESALLFKMRFDRGDVNAPF